MGYWRRIQCVTQNQRIDGVGGKREITRDAYCLSLREVVQRVAREPEYALSLYHLAKVCASVGARHQHLIAKDLFEHLTEHVAQLIAQSLAHRRLCIPACQRGMVR